MNKLYSTMTHTRGHVFAAVDLETTGLEPGYHEIIEIAVVPLNSNLEIMTEARGFCTIMRPFHPERADAHAADTHCIEEALDHGLHPDKVADLLVDWFDSLKLPGNLNLIPLAHNWSSFESPFLDAWLGREMKKHVFHWLPRDTMLLANSINDRAALNAESPPFQNVGLTALCSQLDIPHDMAHRALPDALATVEVYKTLLKRLDTPF